MLLNLAQLGKRQIDVGTRNADSIAAACWDVLNEPNEPTIFRIGNRAVRVFEEEFYDPGSTAQQSRTRLEQLALDSLAHEITRRADFVKTGRTGTVTEKFVPLEVVRHMLACPNPPVPLLKALTHAPCFANDGKLISTPGFDIDSGIYYTPTSDLLQAAFTIGPVTQRQLELAVSLIVDDLLGDFPFVRQSDRANAVALMILFFIREMINGPTPLHLIDKPRPGEGATLLATICAYPAMGFSIPRTPPPSDEGEWRRTIFELLSQGSGVVLFDNLRKLTSTYLASAITSDFVTDRRVGTGSAHRAAVNCVWIATSIDAELSDEVARRILPISIDSGQRNPAQRNNFKISHLQTWAQKNRRRLIEAVLTIVKSWVDAGCPESAKILGGFEKYAAVMGGILEHAGVAGFLDSLPTLIGVHGIGSDFTQASFCWRMHQDFGHRAVLTKDLLEIAREERLIGDEEGEYILAFRLRHMVGRNFSGIWLERGKNDYGPPVWKVVRP